MSLRYTFFLFCDILIQRIGDMMFKLNNKGFSLVEVLAVVVILSVLATIMVPTVSHVINHNKENNYKNVEKSILNAAKMYVSDNRYDITVGACDENGIADVTSFSQNKVLLSTLSSYLSSEEIINPMDDSKKLDFNNSYIIIKFNCNSKKFIYEEFGVVDEGKKSYLKWIN